MEKRKIKIATEVGVVEVEATLFKIYGFEETFAVHAGVNRDGTVIETFDVSELSTGMGVCQCSDTYRKAINAAKTKMNNNKEAWPDIKIRAEKMLTDYKFTYPLNVV